MNGVARSCNLAFILAAVLLTAALCAAQESSDLRDLKLQAKAEIEKEINGLPSFGRHDPQEVITFTLQDGKIHPVTRLPITGADYHSVRLTGLPGWAKVSVLGKETIHTAGDREYIQFLYRDLSVPGTIDVYTEIYSNPDSVNISQEAELPNDGIRSVQLVQAAAEGPRAVALYIQTLLSDGSSLRRSCSGASLAELCQTNPAVIDRYVRPIFRMLRQEQVVFEVDARTAYQVLRDLWHTDPATAAAADSAVAGLGADSYTDRETAMRRLQSLGEPAALYLMDAPWAGRGDEQAMRVQTFLAPYCPLSDEEAVKLESDPDFLLDCQFSSDAAIRRMALAQLGRVTGKKIDPLPTGPAMESAVTKLRLSLIAPSTQP